MEGAGAMKREIVCIECRDHLKRSFGPMNGEYYKFTTGKALDYYLCDQCMKEIRQDEECAALSMWNDTIPYSSWEKAFIQ